MGLTHELVSDLRREIAPMLLFSGRSAIYVGIGWAPEVAQWVAARGLIILGLEGFDCDGAHLFPRLDRIADLSDVTDPERSAEAATSLVRQWRRDVQWIDFVLAPAE